MGPRVALLVSGLLTDPERSTAGLPSIMRFIVKPLIMNGSKITVLMCTGLDSVADAIHPVLTAAMHAHANLSAHLSVRHIAFNSSDSYSRASMCYKEHVRMQHPSTASCEV